MAPPFQKIHVVASCSARWPGGEPLEQLVLRVGYKDRNRIIQYKNSAKTLDEASRVSSEATKPAIWTKENQEDAFIFDFLVEEYLPDEEKFRISVKETARFTMASRRPDGEETVEIQVNPGHEVKTKVGLVELACSITSI